MKRQVEVAVVGRHDVANPVDVHDGRALDAHENRRIEPLLELHERDRASGLMDAPWPPVYPKQPDEPPRVAPSRARKDAV